MRRTDWDSTSTRKKRQVALGAFFESLFRATGPFLMRSRVMYIEKFGGLRSRGGRIGRVYFSQSRRTLHYEGRALQSLRGGGYKANYFDTETGTQYWISGPKRDGNDPLYPGVVEIDDDVNEEYWLKIRGLPALVGTVSYKSLGKYSASGKREKRPAGVLSPKRKKAP